MRPQAGNRLKAERDRGGIALKPRDRGGIVLKPKFLNNLRLSLPFRFLPKKPIPGSGACLN